ncbi:hypothetical protein BD410DRAFT_786439 [Rickenella mellea]|uniref:NmrA-like domain-containing protein n=1 Tax=Rickenella mellea TaxID=50990 RepID=A0A4Y7Q9I0_9AGAM|nr:hypothetical protein BD410DRAFT_786439 [Rickenella mellea]
MSITTAIAGATGNLGLSITRQFLSPTLKPHLSRIIALTRDPSSAKANELRNLGAEIRAVDSSSDDSLRTALEGADVVVNAIGSRSGDMKEKVLDAAVAVGAKVYFPSEFGVYVQSICSTLGQIADLQVSSDHRLNDFPGYEHSEWTTKRAHVERAKQLGAGKMKIISLYTGAFLEMIVSVSPLTFLLWVVLITKQSNSGI